MALPWNASAKRKPPRPPKVRDCRATGVRLLDRQRRIERTKRLAHDAAETCDAAP